MMHRQIYPEHGQSLPAFENNAVNSDAATAMARSVKRHAACDECRNRKLKCSGEPTGCTRCLKQGLLCHYSVQKQMGRPPKKRMREDDHLPSFGLSCNVPWTSDSDLTSLGSSAFGTTENTPSNCTSQTSPHIFFADGNDNHAGQFFLNKPIDTIPTTASPWPDFSNVSSSSANLFTPPPDLSQMQFPPTSPPDSDSSDRQCPCLSCLYLCLSHLSSLAPFPVSHHTLCSLYIGARTAQAVIRCQICPMSFSTGMQNVTFTGTLLTVIADTWLRVSKANAMDLGRQATPPAYAAAIDSSSDPMEGWKDWLRQTVRYGVVGGPYDQAGIPVCADIASLLALIEEMEARQRRWHRSHPLPVEERHLPVPELGSSSEEESCHERDALCMRIIRSARDVIAKFNFEPSDYPDTPEST
ncbi:hypothetical protein BO78DRAFT_353113 [Aspergillus sclerotiicarbonarius CBS 121057]|uniref:Zn(2)-C6 fungal-type domain-containing protein n=1 Tax=Aspergillus sclerotiicarbonarius (strain CBS 121057 / IBT 28362) TaxID=1448318 RepID=A0A319F825_ASPSB|nr:hypothetical protein BO78DRAFT_353113 [Aspergillus sclerotiicarbonarius CBS 121057]